MPAAAPANVGVPVRGVAPGESLASARRRTQTLYAAAAAAVCFALAFSHTPATASNQ
jgi:hypothetical protein